MSARASSGIKGLDVVIEDGFPRNSLILLAGNPGTGKTIFSAQFLIEGAKSGERGVYVSFAEDKNQYIKNVSRHLNYDLKKLIEKDKIKIFDFSTLRPVGLSACLDKILKEVESLGAKRLVIDPFSAMVYGFKEPIDSRVVMHTVLGKIVRKMDCTTLVTVEVPLGEDHVGMGMEEFVADGVILLRFSKLNGRLLRELEIVKLRGTELMEKQMLYTLHGGFKVVNPFKPKPIDKPRRFQPIPDSKECFSTGSKELDEMLDGGYPKGGGILLDVAERVSTLGYTLIVMPIGLNFCVQGRSVMVVPPFGVDDELVKNLTLSYGLTEDEINRLLRVCDVPTPLRDQSKPYTVTFEGEDLQKDYEKWMKVYNELQYETKQPILSITGLDKIVGLYGIDVAGKMFSIDATRIRQDNTIVFVIAKPGYEELVKKLSAQAEVHLKLTRKYGVLLLYGVKPRTQLYALEMDVSKGYPMPKLTPII